MLRATLAAGHRGLIAQRSRSCLLVEVSRPQRDELWYCKHHATRHHLIDNSEGFEPEKGKHIVSFVVGFSVHLELTPMAIGHPVSVHNGASNVVIKHDVSHITPISLFFELNGDDIVM
jgi:hypothetical protein